MNILKHVLYGLVGATLTTMMLFFLLGIANLIGLLVGGAAVGGAPTSAPVAANNPIVVAAIDILRAQMAASAQRCVCGWDGMRCLVVD